MASDLRVLVVGLGNMGMSHARAYHALDGFRLGRAVRALDSANAAICRRSGATCRASPISTRRWPR